MQVCVYHSAEWETLVETGWITHSVSVNVDGVKVATMLHNRVRFL